MVRETKEVNQLTYHPPADAKVSFPTTTSLLLRLALAPSSGSFPAVSTRYFVLSFRRDPTK